MFTLLILISFWHRPEAIPVGQVEKQRCGLLEQVFSLAGETSPASFDWYSPDRISGQFVVGFEPGTEVEVSVVLEQAGIRIVRCDRQGAFFVCRSDMDRPDLLLAEKEGIRYVEPDLVVRATKIPNDPMFLQHQWDKWVMYADKAWDVTAGSPGVRVAVIDNGVQYWHPDLSDRFVAGELGYDFVGRDEDPRPDNPSLAEAFHGTHVSGIIAGVMDNATGIAGWAQVQLMAVRVLNDSGSGSLSDLASGIRWAVDRGCRILNMSLGANANITPVSEACVYAAQKNAVLLAAAGNDGTSVIQYPAALPQCISVGATDQASELADFSNYGPEQELVAPGVNILSTGLNSAYVLASGTSMACPQVAGVAALILAANNSLTAVRVRSILAASALDMGEVGRDVIFGYGFVSAYRALELAASMRAAEVGQEAGALRATICRGPVFLSGQSGRISDIQGRRVGRLKAGEWLNVKAGTYFLEIDDADGKVRQKLVVLP